MEVNMLTGKGAGPILLIIAIFVLIPALSAGDSNMTTADNIKRSNEFALKFFYEINRADPGDNTFISPFSMRAVLAMTLNGANGPTKEEMRAALGFGGLSDDAINNYFQKITKALENTDPKVELNIANSVWMLTDAPFNRSFLDLVSNFYDAEVDRADDPEPINQWVRSKTNNKIQNIIERISPDDLMLLLNAVYFKGEWKTKFDTKSNTIRDFQTLENGPKKTTFMSQSRKFSYFENHDMQSIALDYAGGQIRMHIFLPSKTNRDYKSFLNEIDSDNWLTWMRKYHEKEGTVFLPKFKLEYEKTVNDILKAMGIILAFDRGRADFSNLIENAKPGDAFISEAKQKTFVEVNEEGTEAAAVSSVLMKKIAYPADNFVMEINRPFVCAIVDNETGEILFIGSIVDPIE